MPFTDPHSSTKEQMTSSTAVTTSTTTSTTSTRSVGPTHALIVGGDSKDEQKKKVFLAIFVPLAVLGLIIALFITWLYLRTKAPKKHVLLHDNLNSKFRPREDELMEKYIMKRRSFEIKPTDSAVFGNRSRPVTSISTVQNSLPDVYPSPVYDTPQQNYIPTSFFPPTVEDADTNQPIHVKLGYLGNGSPQHSSYSSGSKNNRVTKNPLYNDQNDNNHTSKPPSENAVVMRVDNTVGVTALKSAPNGDVYQTEGPAVIVPEVERNRISGTAHVIPGDSPNDYAALYIKM